MNDTNALRARIVTWAESNGRDLPWRLNTSTFSLLLAEVLLQKTRAHDVVPVWRRLSTAYSSPADLAHADPQTLLDLVRSLGLGRQRVQRLQTAAAWASTKQGDLRGLGPYGQAVICLSRGERAKSPPVDGNVARVISRLYGLRFPRGEARKKPEVSSRVQSLMGDASPRAQLKVIYALVDLGALICTPRAPLCGTCPARADCKSSQLATPSPTALPRGGGTASDTSRN
jgi:A/G-specific adenine glycosylase